MSRGVYKLFMNFAPMDKMMAGAYACSMDKFCSYNNRICSEHPQDGLGSTEPFQPSCGFSL